MSVFNRRFFDLNAERQYILHQQDTEFPYDVITDLKLTVPETIDAVYIAAVYVKKGIVRILFSSEECVLFSFYSDDADGIQTEKIYTISDGRGYGGFVVFGKGIKEEVACFKKLRISEECVVRSKKSEIPFIAVPCSDKKLIGEVTLTNSNAEDGYIKIEGKDVLFGLNDTGNVDELNPQITYANGINSFNDVPIENSFVYRINSVYANDAGEITLRFGPHFSLYAIGSNEDTSETIVGVAVGTDISMEDLCYTHPPGDPGDRVPQCPVSFVKKE